MHQKYYRKLLLLCTIVGLLYGIGLAAVTTPVIAQATEVDVTALSIGYGYAVLGISIGVGMGLLGAGIGLGIAGAAAAAAVAEKPEIFGPTLIYIVFCEAIAIYALVMLFYAFTALSTFFTGGH
ncbi:MAG: hypothetical protein DRN20_05425 [Thermoplasmata archaeon]|nr:MAG: hypothetical protein DRN20_05425 [Thermoplasmata archaeon]